MEKYFSAEFKKCPACGSERRFFEELGNELRERGLASPNFAFALDAKQGVVVDQTKAHNIPIGGEIPGFYFETDICMDCGCVYAKKLRRQDGKKSPSRPLMVRLPHLTPVINAPRLS